jgi:hypothetical protein
MLSAGMTITIVHVVIATRLAGSCSLKRQSFFGMISLGQAGPAMLGDPQFCTRSSQRASRSLPKPRNE